MTCQSPPRAEIPDDGSGFSYQEHRAPEEKLVKPDHGMKADLMPRMQPSWQ